VVGGRRVNGREMVACDAGGAPLTAGRDWDCYAEEDCLPLNVGRLPISLCR